MSDTLSPLAGAAATTSAAACENHAAALPGGQATVERLLWRAQACGAGFTFMRDSVRAALREAYIVYNLEAD
jgi:hypothetical protein